MPETGKPLENIEYLAFRDAINGLEFESSPGSPLFKGKTTCLRFIGLVARIVFRDVASFVATPLPPSPALVSQILSQWPLLAGGNTAA